MGIDHSLEAIADFRALGIDTAKVVKELLSAPSSIPVYLKIAGLVTELLAMIRDIMKSVPELKELDKEESVALTQAFWEACQAIVLAVL